MTSLSPLHYLPLLQPSLRYLSSKSYSYCILQSDSIGITEYLFACQWNSSALFLFLFFHLLTVVSNAKQMFSVSN